MIKAGLTGGIGSGKSTVARVFEKLGIPVFNSDLEASKLFNQPSIQNAVIKEFGESILSHKTIDKKKLAAIVFSSPQNLSRLNAIIHPEVRKAFDTWEKKQSKKNPPYLIQEAAILIETGRYKFLDYNILVTAPEELRIKRVIARDKVKKEQVLERMKNQLPDVKKKKFVQAFIVNDDKQLVIPQVLNIHQQLLKLRSQRLL